MSDEQNATHTQESPELPQGATPEFSQFQAKYRVGAFVSAFVRSTAQQLDFLGYGFYSGDEPCPIIGGRNNPKITLDNGDVVWGCECYWGAEDKFKRHYDDCVARGIQINHVRIEDFRPKEEDLSSFDPLNDPDKPVVGSKIHAEGHDFEILKVDYVVTDMHGNIDTARSTQNMCEPEELRNSADSRDQDSKYRVALITHPKYKQIHWACWVKKILPMPTQEQVQSSLEHLL